MASQTARAGVRPSIEDPGRWWSTDPFPFSPVLICSVLDVYIHSNVLGTTILLDLARKWKSQIKHTIYASSSSVYGRNEKVPYAETDPTDDAVSPYAASKKACEVMATAYANMFQIQVTGLRFFTVYGPRGRPDMVGWLSGHGLGWLAAGWAVGLVFFFSHAIRHRTSLWIVWPRANASISSERVTARVTTPTLMIS